jgi:hypothetical protein
MRTLNVVRAYAKTYLSLICWESLDSYSCRLEEDNICSRFAARSAPSTFLIKHTQWDWITAQNETNNCRRCNERSPQLCRFLPFFKLSPYVPDIGNITSPGPHWIVWQVIVLIEKNNSATLENILLSLGNTSFFAACTFASLHVDTTKRIYLWAGLKEKFRYILFYESPDIWRCLVL